MNVVSFLYNKDNIHLTNTDFEKTMPLYLIRIGGWKHQYPICRNDGWPDYQWIQCIEGRGKLKLYNKEQTIERGQGMLLYPNEYHEYYALSDHWEVRWLSFNGAQVRDILHSLQFNHSQVLLLSDPEAMLHHMDKLKTAAVSDHPMNILDCSAIIYHMIMDLYRFGSKADIPSRQQYFDQLSPALQYIHEHYHEPISLQDLATQLGVSSHHTCVLFRNTLKMRPFEYINLFRLRKANELLLNNPTLSIKEAARLVGYDSPSYFIKLYKRILGSTPRKFRENGIN